MMRLQISFLAIILAVIYQCQCQSSTTSKPPSWAYDKNYEIEEIPNYDDNYGKDDGEDDDNYNYSSNDTSPDRNRRSPDEYANVNLYFRVPSDSNKYKKFKKVRFPVNRFDRKRAPRFSPLMSFSPWLPFFVHRRSKQTVIASPIGGFFIIPPVINFYGKMFAVGELIASGYCSLVSSGGPPPPGIDVAPLVRPGGVAGPGIPPVNTNTGGFTGGVRTQIRSFGPKYPSEVEGGGAPPPRGRSQGYGY